MSIPVLRPDYYLDFIEFLFLSSTVKQPQQKPQFLGFVVTTELLRAGPSQFQREGCTTRRRFLNLFLCDTLPAPTFCPSFSVSATCFGSIWYSSISVLAFSFSRAREVFFSSAVVSSNCLLRLEYNRTIDSSYTNYWRNCGKEFHRMMNFLRFIQKVNFGWALNWSLSSFITWSLSKLPPVSTLWLWRGYLDV